MASKYLKLRGKVAWAKNLFTVDESKFGKFWSVILYPDEESKKAMKEAGIGLQPVKNSDFPGEDGYKFRCPVTKLIKDELVRFEKPPILNPDGTTLQLPEGVFIGNGSIMELNVVAFETQKGEGPVGHRLLSSTLLELVPYEKQTNPLPEETKTSVTRPTKKW